MHLHDDGPDAGYCNLLGLSLAHLHIKHNYLVRFHVSFAVGMHSYKCGVIMLLLACASVAT